MASDKQDSDGHDGIFGRIWERFGDVAKKLGLVGDADVQDALARQQGTIPRKRIGEILMEDGKLSRDHVDQVLDKQKRLMPGAEPKTAADDKKPAKKKAKKSAPKAAKKAKPKKAKAKAKKK
jgi:hypothetical protein